MERKGARTACAGLELVFIALTIFQLSGAQPVIFHYGPNTTLALQVPSNPSAGIIELVNDDITCLGDFSQDAGIFPRALGLSVPNVSGPSPQGIDVTGRCLYKNPIKLVTQQCGIVTSFSTMFEFEYSPYGFGGSGTLQGLAFIIASDNFTQGDAGGYLGWLNSTTNSHSGQSSSGHNFAVEIDFFQDIQFQDPVGLHVGLDTNSLTSLQTSPLSWKNSTLIESDESGYSGTSVNIWIEYDGLAQILKVFASGYGSYRKPSVPTLSSAIDLRELLSQEGMFVGFSGSISNLTLSNQISRFSERTSGLGYTIIDWTFNSNGLAPDYPRDADGDPVFGHEDNHLSKRAQKIIIVSVTVPSVFMILTLVFVIYKLYRRIARLAALAKKYEIEKGLLDEGPKHFKYKTLSRATKGFSSDGFLGSGGFGSVYKGMLFPKGAKEPTEIAVKRISAASQQGAGEFLAEVKVIGQVQHRNLVRLLGWCHERGELLLVYDFMPNGSLDQHLFNTSEEAPALTWARRLKIVSGVATALAYLHEEWEKRVIHRDVKSSNVMLDSDFNARLGDFGLARLSEHDQAPQSTAVLAGTYGYLAPELTQTLKATEKTDVYSFGAMVLEVATGKRPILSFKDQKTYNAVLLVDWVWSLYTHDSLLDAADCRLHGEYNPGEMSMFLKIGLLCSHPDPDERPQMREVLNIWKGSSVFPLLPRTKPIPIFISNYRDTFNGPDTRMSMAMDVYGNSDDVPGDRTFMINTNVHSTTTVPSQDDGHSYEVENQHVGQNTGAPNSTLHCRRSKTTTSLPL